MSAQPEIVISALPADVIIPSSPSYIQLFFNKADGDRLYGKRSDGIIFLIQGAGGGGVNSVTADFPLLATPGLNPVISITDAPIGDVLTGNGPGLDPTFQTPSAPVVPTLAEVLTSGNDADVIGIIRDNSAIDSVDINRRGLVYGDGITEVLNWDSLETYDAGGLATIGWAIRVLYNSSAGITLDWELLEITGAWAKNSVPILTGFNATASLSFPETPAQQSSDLTIAVIGAAIGDPVTVGYPPASAPMRTCYTAFVSAADVVTVRFNNYSALDVTPATGDFNVICMKLNP